MRTMTDVRDEVLSTLGDLAGDYDIEGILDDLRGLLEFDERRGFASVDTIESDRYWEIIGRHDTTA